MWLWFRSQSLQFPLRQGVRGEVRWVAPTYTAIHHILTNPVYAGAYVYGKTKHGRFLDQEGNFKKRTRHLPVGEWAVLLPEHHPGFIDWATYQANQERIDSRQAPASFRDFSNWRHAFSDQ